MQNVILIIATVLTTLLPFSVFGINEDGIGREETVSDLNKIHVQCADEIMATVESWSSEFQRLNPKNVILITAINEKEQNQESDLYIISGQKNQIENEQLNWKITIGHNALVPVINAKNPFADQILEKGITIDEFKTLLSETGILGWESILEGIEYPEMQVFMQQGLEVRNQLANFVNGDLENPEIVYLPSANEVLEKTAKSRSALGFLPYEYLLQVEANMTNLAIVPIDRNGNGRLDYTENFYNSKEEITRALWIGKYPRELRGDIIAASDKEPTKESVKNFLVWICNEGQRYLPVQGYAGIASIESRENLALLAPSSLTATQNIASGRGNRVFVWIGLAVLLLIGFMYAIARRRRNDSVIKGDINLSSAFNEEMLDKPQGLFFDKSHTWAFMDKNGLVKVGVDDFIQHITGRISKVIMKKPGEEVRKGDKLLTLIHQGKQLNLYSPVSGSIVSQNTQLNDDSDLLNASPFEKGWIYQIKPVKWTREIQFMLMGSAYGEWLNEEFTRLKDFLASTVRSNKNAYDHLVLQDGGEITDNVLADMEPEIWEDFQSGFLDKSK